MNNNKKNLNHRLILCDCDNTILNWEYAFHVWMSARGYVPKVDDPGLLWDTHKQYGISKRHALDLIIQFNTSASIGFLPALRDAHEYVRKLNREHGYTFCAVTSFTDDPDAVTLRKMNLEKVFSPGVFSHVECLSIESTSKKEYLSNYMDSGCYWIEDVPKYAIEGYEVGLKPILIEHGYNMTFHHPYISVLKNWKEIYEMITHETVS